MFIYILIYFNLKYLGKKDQPIDIHRRAVVHMNCLPLQYLHISTVLASTIDLLVSFIHYTVPLKKNLPFCIYFQGRIFCRPSWCILLYVSPILYVKEYSTITEHCICSPVWYFNKDRTVTEHCIFSPVRYINKDSTITEHSIFSPVRYVNKDSTVTEHSILYKTESNTIQVKGKFCDCMEYHESLCQWVSDCCLTPSQQFFSYIMARTGYFQWDDDEVRFVLDQHAELDFYSASSLKQQSAADMSLHSDTLFWFRANQSLLFLLLRA